MEAAVAKKRKEQQKEKEHEEACLLGGFGFLVFLVGGLCAAYFFLIEGWTAGFVFSAIALAGLGMIGQAIEKIGY